MVVESVEDIRPIDSLPHCLRDLRNRFGAREVVGKGLHTTRGERDADSNLDGEGNGTRDQRRPHDPQEVRSQRLGPCHFYAHCCAPFTPVVADERERGRFEGLHGDHDETPSDSIEDAPSRGVVGAEKNDAANKPEVEGVADGGLGERIHAGPREDLEGCEAGFYRLFINFGTAAEVIGLLLLLLPLQFFGDIGKIGEASEGRAQVAGQSDQGLGLCCGREGADMEAGDEEEVKRDIDDEFNGAD